VRFARSTFTKKNDKRRDNMHVGRRVGVDDARVHIKASRITTASTLTAPLIMPNIDILIDDN
jgi:hypothetical protein